MITTSSNLCPNEAAFRDQVVDRFWDAGIPTITERALSKNGDRTSLLRADILIGRFPQIGCIAVIECKISTDSQSLCTALGQALIYRAAFGADQSVICFPWDVMVPTLFVEVCEKHEVKVASDKTIIDIVDPDRTIRDGDCFGPMLASLQDFRRKLCGERLDSWSENARRVFKNNIRWIAELYERL